mmetsp:Transcript_88017/g.224075  ORF Transcript_88017/g.224075 Transcript_88017/m.224075 type:complete len:249 (-) Transcript_88017:107-853(-)
MERLASMRMGRLSFADCPRPSALRPFSAAPSRRFIRHRQRLRRAVTCSRPASAWPSNSTAAFAVTVAPMPTALWSFDGGQCESWVQAALRPTARPPEPSLRRSRQPSRRLGRLGRRSLGPRRRDEGWAAAAGAEAPRTGAGRLLPPPPPVPPLLRPRPVRARRTGLCGENSGTKPGKQVDGVAGTGERTLMIGFWKTIQVLGRSTRIQIPVERSGARTSMRIGFGTSRGDVSALGGLSGHSAMCFQQV